MKYIKGKDNVIADALSRISINDLKEINSDNDKQVLVTTRSMTRQANLNENLNGSVSNDKSEENIDKVKVYENLVATYNKKIPRIRTTNLVLNTEKGIIGEIEVSAFEKHRKIFRAGLQNEKVTLKSLLSKIDEKAQNLKKKDLQIPRNDELFNVVDINEFKRCCELYFNWLTTMKPWVQLKEAIVHSMNISDRILKIKKMIGIHI